MSLKCDLLWQQDDSRLHADELARLPLTETTGAALHTAIPFVGAHWQTKHVHSQSCT